MSKDRLQELKKSIKWADVLYSEIPQQDGQINEPAPRSQSTIVHVDNLTLKTDFLKEIDGIRSDIDHIEEWITEIQQIHIRLLEPFPDPSFGKVLDEKKSQITAASDRVTDKLKELENEQKATDPKTISPAQRRIQESQIFVTTRIFRNTMMRYNQEICQHRDRCKNAIKRELELAGSRKSDDELEEIIENGFPGTYYLSLLLDVEKARQSLDMIQARHGDILKIEKSIQELHRIFREMATLIGDQGTMIDSIEYNVRSAGTFVDIGVREVEKAKEIKDETTKKKVCLIFTVIAATAGLLLLIILLFVSQRFVFG